MRLHRCKVAVTYKCTTKNSEENFVFHTTHTCILKSDVDVIQLTTTPQAANIHSHVGFMVIGCMSALKAGGVMCGVALGGIGG